MIQNLIIEVSFYHAEFKIDLYCDDETFSWLNMVLIIEVWGFFQHSNLVSFWLGHKTRHLKDQLRDSCERKPQGNVVCPMSFWPWNLHPHSLFEFSPFYLSKLKIFPLFQLRLLRFLLRLTFRYTAFASFVFLHRQCFPALIQYRQRYFFFPLTSDMSFWCIVVLLLRGTMAQWVKHSSESVCLGLQPCSITR